MAQKKILILLSFPFEARQGDMFRWFGSQGTWQMAPDSLFGKTVYNGTSIDGRDAVNFQWVRPENIDILGGIDAPTPPEPTTNPTPWCALTEPEEPQKPLSLLSEKEARIQELERIIKAHQNMDLQSNTALISMVLRYICDLYLLDLNEQPLPIRKLMIENELEITRTAVFHKLDGDDRNVVNDWLNHFWFSSSKPPTCWEQLQKAKLDVQGVESAFTRTKEILAAMTLTRDHEIEKRKVAETKAKELHLQGLEQAELINHLRDAATIEDVLRRFRLGDPQLLGNIMADLFPPPSADESGDD